MVTGAIPTLDVDHDDGNGRNNAWRNLRRATMSQNIANSKLSCANTSGHKGVSLDRRSQRWTAQIKINYKKIHIGTFDTKREALFAREAKEQELFGQFARRK